MATRSVTPVCNRQRVNSNGENDSAAEKEVIMEDEETQRRNAVFAAERKRLQGVTDTLSASSKPYTSSSFRSSLQREGEDDLLSPQQQRGDLLTLEQVPGWLKFNQFITAGYRPPMTPFEAMMSMVLYIHNESFNFWSHFVPLIFHVYIMVSNPLPPPNAPFLWHVCLTSFVFIFLSSVCYHTFMPCCKTAQGYSQLLCVDILGSLMAITVTSTSFTMLGDPCMSIWVRLSYFMVLCCTCTALVVVTLTGHITPMKRFVFFGTHCVLRTVIALIIMKGRKEREGHFTALYYHLMSYVSLFVGGLINALRLPERLFPNVWWLNYSFNSHNLWHLFSIFASSQVLWGLYYTDAEYAVSPCASNV